MKWDEPVLPDGNQARWLAGIEAALTYAGVTGEQREITRLTLTSIVADAYDAGHDAGYSDATEGEAMA